MCVLFPKTVHLGAECLAVGLPMSFIPGPEDLVPSFSRMYEEAELARSQETWGHWGGSQAQL